MNILVVGSGGREHTLAWKIAQSEMVDRLYCVPGNPGMATLGECVNLPLADDGFLKLREFAVSAEIDLTVVGPEAPLVAGISDVFAEKGLKVFGPSKAAARIEDSKSFSKSFMNKYGIPTAVGESFDDPNDAIAYVRENGPPIVVKADGSAAAGKGVFVCDTVDDAITAVKRIMIDRIFGDAGNRVVVEECLTGEEASFIVLTDGENIIPMATSQDHKRVFDDDKGPNTGGMGAYSPAPVVTPELQRTVMERIIMPAVRGMKEEGTPYTGALYAGLMITDGEPKVLEFNCRFGDPETQVILPRMKSDIVPALLACVDGGLDRVNVEWRDEAAVCVVMASGGYPGKYTTGKPITGIDAAEKMEDVVVFQAGTKVVDDVLVTGGGRVLGVTALGCDIPDAIRRAYKAVALIEFADMHYRRDIGRKAMDRFKN